VTNIAASSYTLAAIGFLVLGLPVLSGWRGRAQRGTLSLACLATAAWAGVLAWDAEHRIVWSTLGSMLEVLRDGAWSLFLVALLGNWHNAAKGEPDAGPLRLRALRPSLLLAGAAYLVLLAVLGTGWWQPTFRASFGVTILAAFMGLAVYGMLLVEQVYRNKTVEERWAIKFACLGIGGMFAYDFYLYSNTMLFRELNPDLWTRAAWSTR
jgi:hypothetical protein